MVLNNLDDLDNNLLYKALLKEICIKKENCSKKQDIKKNSSFFMNILIKRIDNIALENQNLKDLNDDKFMETNLKLDYSRFYNTNSHGDLDFHFDLWRDQTTKIDNVSFIFLKNNNLYKQI